MPSAREEDLLRENDQFIIREASKAAGKIITRSDEEYSIALAAFWEAIRTHDPEKGSLQAYGAVVIRHRLVDYYRSQKKYASEMTVEPAVFGGETVEGAEGVQQAIEKAQAQNQPDTDLTEEISALSQELKRYGISFFDLPDQCPKAAKTRKVCKKAARFVAFAERLLEKLRKTMKFPLPRWRRACRLPGNCWTSSGSISLHQQKSWPVIFRDCRSISRERRMLDAKGCGCA